MISLEKIQIYIVLKAKQKYNIMKTCMNVLTKSHSYDIHVSGMLIEVEIVRVEVIVITKFNKYQENWITKLPISLVILKNLTDVKFSLPGLSVNKMVKIINGNKHQKGYKLALWNCGRGLLQCDGLGKLAEVKQFIESKRPHCFGIVEADLFFY